MATADSASNPPLWIDASNLSSGGGITHLVEIAPRLASLWQPAAVTVFAGRKERDLLSRCSETLCLPEVVELDGGLAGRLRWQRHGYPRLIGQAGGGIAFAPGGLLTGRFPPGVVTVTMCRNMLPFEWREAARYGPSRMLLRLALLRRGQFRSFRRADGVIFLSRYAAELVGDRLPETVLKAVVPHGIGEGFRRKPDAERLRRPPANLLYVSIVDVYKHQWRVVEAVKRLADRGYPLVLWLAGADYSPARRRLDGALRRAGLGDRVRLLGEVGHESLAEVYHGVDLFVYASSCENLPNILLEAMAAGLPIACSDRGPMPEVGMDGAVYFNPEDSTRIADAVERLICDPDLRLRCATRAFELASAYSWESCAERTAAFLREAWVKRRASKGGR